MQTFATTVCMIGLGAVPAIAIESADELRQEIKDCGSDAICAFDAFERAVASDNVLAELGPYSLIGLQGAGIVAAANADNDIEAIGILDRAIRVTDEVLGDYFDHDNLSNVFHFLRAEACLRIEDERCFIESADAMLEFEIWRRSSAIRSERHRAEADCYRKYRIRQPGAAAKAREDCESKNFDPPMNWSKIKDLPGGGGFGDIGQLLENVPPGGSPRMRVDAILTEAERRMQ